MSTQAKPLSKTVVPCTPNRILVVDDEKSIREIFFQVLSYGIKDCRLDLAVNGLEAVNMFREVHHTVLLMDLRMPVMDGKEAFDAICQYCADNHWEMPAVVFCTGYATPRDVSAIVSASPKHCVLQKPVGNDVLVEVLKTRLKGGW